jgi:hypothetical protein
MDELKEKVVQYLLTRLEIREPEAQALAEDIYEVHRLILAGTKPEDIMDHIDKFLCDFSTDIQIIEQRSQRKSKYNSYAEKRRTQMDIFAAATEQA